ncbi:putative toxin-antitoxin system toxin component, PIN family [Herbaspirillum sp. CF444]|uniref:putative toxin-antitoxin system toxin component, PIN family n=1 Tax=Herbaspirillum sp. CF444 TaxID=1144319 RepID=UPI000272399B|nr:putative toxin-antitoxin system toxin component, PIN family [Herbaspirillum sp. CF444]EJL93005.1 putative toxin-antitoxin system toxin component, PIN family [Herbaspirillum sp. CF444]
MTISTETSTAISGGASASDIHVDARKTRRIVLDTNVCLDLFVFRDPRWARLLQAMENREVHAVTRADCRMEWLVVLNYPHLPLKEDDKPAIRAEFDRLIACLPDAVVNTFGLPACTDPDDQKFLELSLQAEADVLITKDKALLKLAKKTARKNMFAIMTPQTWHAALDTGDAQPASA